jgi:mannitol-specific phosphotransferase system IIBC component
MNIYKAVGWRFLRGGVAGALGSMVAIQGSVGDWTDFSYFLNKLVLAGLIGFLTGGLLAAEKAYRFK